MERTNQQLWENIKDLIMSLEIVGTKANQWSARKAQLSVKLYKEMGGEYIGKKDKNNSLTRWTNQNWRTKSGLPSSITKERYLPFEAIQNLTPEQYYLTSLAKQKSTKQYSNQPKEIANITKYFR
jgi:hypothetical protein